MNNIQKKILGGFFSSTMWFGFMVMAATWLENNTQMLSALVDSQYSNQMGYAIGLAIWFLRWITKVPVENKMPGNKIDTEKSPHPLLHDGDEEKRVMMWKDKIAVLIVMATLATLWVLGMQNFGYKVFE